MPIRLSVTRVHDTSVVTRSSPYTDPDTPLNQQPVGQTGFGDPVVSEEFNGAVTVTDAGLGYVRFRTGGPSWASWYPNWPRFNAQSPGGNHTNTDQAAYYATSKLTVTGGSLVLACDKQTTVAGLDYTAGMIQSLPFYTPNSGYFEARLKVAATVSGCWPAWWSSCSNFDQWPPEIDFWELFGPSPTYESHIYMPGGGTAFHDTGNVATQTDFHAYGCKWEANTVTWYCDGTQTAQASRTITDPLYLLLNNGARAPMSPTFNSNDLTVDYIRCWNLPS